MELWVCQIIQNSVALLWLELTQGLLNNARKLDRLFSDFSYQNNIFSMMQS